MLPQTNHNTDVVYRTKLQLDGMSLCLAATEHGLVYADVPDSTLPLEKWIGRHFPGCSMIDDEEKMRPYLSAFKQYWQGKRTTFSLPLDLRGTAFQRQVWLALAGISYGTTCTYSDIAAQIGKPTAVRAVGAAIGSNPILIAIPCHRVIGKNGSLTGFRSGLDLKQKLLKMEGCHTNLIHS